MAVKGEEPRRGRRGEIKWVFVNWEIEGVVVRGAREVKGEGAGGAVIGEARRAGTFAVITEGLGREIVIFAQKGERVVWVEGVEGLEGEFEAGDVEEEAASFEAGVGVATGRERADEAASIFG